MLYMCLYCALHIWRIIKYLSIYLYANFSEKECLDLSGDISPYMRTFPKGRIYGWSRPAGKHISPRPSSAAGVVGNYLPVSLTSHSSKNHLSKSNNLDMFELEAYVLFNEKQVCALFLLF